MAKPAAAGEAAATVAGSPPRSRFGAVFTIVAAGVAMSQLDLFVVNVALPSISHGFPGVSLSSLSWVLNGYAVIFGALLVPAGSYADRTSPRRAYLLGVGVFTVGSAVCAAAPDIWVLIGARLLQAAGAAMLIPASLGLLLISAPADRRAAAVRNWAALSGLAAALGPVIGGVLAQADWRWVFIINLPVGAATLVFAARMLTPTPGQTGRGTGDLPGALLLILGIGLIALALVRAQAWGWASLPLAGTLAAAVCLLALFTWRSARQPAPVLPLKLLRLPAIQPAMVANVLFAVAFSAMLLSVALWCQQIWHWSALQTGLAIAPGPIMVPLLTRPAGVLVGRCGAGVAAMAGCLLFAVGVGWWVVALNAADHNYLLGLLPGLVLTGVGVCLALPTLIGVAVSRMPGASFATGSGIVTMGRQIGSVLGVAGWVAVLAGSRGGVLSSVSAFDHGWEFTLAAAVVTLAACALLLPHTRPPAKAPART